MSARLVGRLTPCLPLLFLVLASSSSASSLAKPGVALGRVYHGKLLSPWLDAHNDVYRRTHGADPLSWNGNAAMLAQSWCDVLATEKGGRLTHPHGGVEVMRYLTIDRAQLGQNLAMATMHLVDVAAFDEKVGPEYEATVKQMVKLWYGESRDYDFTTPTGFSARTGHFTQLVWKSTTRVGCGLSRVRSAAKSLFGDVIVGCCDYNPAGNVQGEFVTNVMRKNTLPSPVGSGPASVFLPVPVLLRTEKEMWLIAHNERYRASHGALPLKWKPSAAALAQKWCDKLVDERGGQLAHPEGKEETGKYMALEGRHLGQNLAMMTMKISDPEAFKQRRGKEYDAAVHKMVTLWYEEVHEYDFEKPTGFSARTGHFTQVVWKATTEVGCGLSQVKGKAGSPYV